MLGRIILIGGVLVVIIAMGLIAFSALRRRLQPKATPTPPVEAPAEASAEEELLAVTPEEALPELRANFEDASRLAKNWSSQAALVNITVKLTGPTKEGGTLTYVFDSPEEPGLHYTISYKLDSGSYVRAIIPEEDFLGGGLRPIELRYWKTSYVEALQIAEKNGGADFRRDGPVTSISLTLQHGEPRGWLWWTVEYEAKGKSPFRLQINPFHKEVLKEETPAVPEESEAPTETSL